MPQNMVLSITKKIYHCIQGLTYVPEIPQHWTVLCFAFLIQHDCIGTVTVLFLKDTFFLFSEIQTYKPQPFKSKRSGDLRKTGDRIGRNKR